MVLPAIGQTLQNPVSNGLPNLIDYDSTFLLRGY